MEQTLCKIGVLTDSHVGIRQDNGWNQPVWVGGEETLFERLSEWKAANNVDFFIHCGDVAEPGSTKKAIRLLASLGCPVAAVRGNHDIIAPACYKDWRDGLLPYPTLQFGDSVFENEHCDVILLNNQWFDSNSKPQWHWETSPVGWLNDGQLNWLDSALASRKDRSTVSARRPGQTKHFESTLEWHQCEIRNRIVITLVTVVYLIQKWFYVVLLL